MKPALEVCLEEVNLSEIGWVRRSQPDGGGTSRQRNSLSKSQAENEGRVYLRNRDTQPGRGGESWSRSQKCEGRVVEGGLGVQLPLEVSGPERRAARWG